MAITMEKVHCALQHFFQIMWMTRSQKHPDQKGDKTLKVRRKNLNVISQEENFQAKRKVSEG